MRGDDGLRGGNRAARRSGPKRIAHTPSKSTTNKLLQRTAPPELGIGLLLPRFLQMGHSYGVLIPDR